MPHFRYSPASGKPACIFKMQIQAAEVQIDGSYYGHFIITDHLLRMDETRCIFIDPHPFCCQSCIIASGHLIDQRFVWNPRRNNSYIYPAFRCQRQRTLHLITDDQVWCGDIHIFFCPFDHIQVDILSGTFPIQRAVCIRLHKSSFSRTIGRLQQVRDRIFLLPLRCIPHLQEDQCQTAYTIPGQLDSGILPFSIWMSQVKIFIGQIISTGKSHFSINHCDLTVIPVIHEYIQNWNQWIKHLALDSFSSQLFHKFFADKANAAHIIIKNPHIQSCGRFFFQNLLNSFPGN